MSHLYLSALAEKYFSKKIFLVFFTVDFFSVIYFYIIFTIWKSFYIPGSYIFYIFPRTYENGKYYRLVIYCRACKYSLTESIVENIIKILSKTDYIFMIHLPCNVCVSTTIFTHSMGLVKERVFIINALLNSFSEACDLKQVQFFLLKIY
jgi:hypothetical protein